jgi:hypothetical protein
MIIDVAPRIDIWSTNLILFRPINTMYAWLMKYRFDILQQHIHFLPYVRQRHLQSDQMEGRMEAESWSQKVKTTKTHQS